MYAGVTILVEPADEFSYTVSMRDVSPEYLDGIRNGVLSVLLGQDYSAILACAINIESVKVHDSDSSYLAFFRVAQEATRKLLGIDSDDENNVQW